MKIEPHLAMLYFEWQNLALIAHCHSIQMKLLRVYAQENFSHLLTQYVDFPSIRHYRKAIKQL